MKTVLRSVIQRKAGSLISGNLFPGSLFPGNLIRGAFVVVVICVAMAAQPHFAAHAAEGSGNADEFLVVDCLLPGKVRRLGTRVTYVTARKAVKTTASECAIRGGEYTSADRASYTTALKIWLPLANQGDPVAQTYVGEIYEKGLGVPPEYSLAANWYNKAAEQNYARAQLNLGALYEKGLGVPKDKAKAVSWYRRASGLSDGTAPYVPAEAAAEIKQLKEDKKALEAERDKLRQELGANRTKLDSVETQYQKSAKDAEVARGALAAAQKQLEADVAAGRQDRILKISMDMANRSRELAEREGEATRLRDQVAALQKKSSSLESALSSEKAGRQQDTVRFEEVAERYRVEAAAAREDAQSFESNLARANGAMSETRNAETRQRKRADGEREQVAALNAKLAKQQRQAAADRDKEAKLQQELAAKRKSLAQNAQTQDRLRLRKEFARRKKAESQVAALQSNLKEQRQSSERESARESELRRRLAIQQEVLTVERSKSAALRKQSSALAQKSASLGAESKRRIAAEAVVRALQKDLAAQQQSTARERVREKELNAKLAAQQKSLTAARKKSNALETKTARLAQEKEAREAAQSQVAELLARIEEQKKQAAENAKREAQLKEQLAARRKSLESTRKQAAALASRIEALKKETALLKQEREKRDAAERKLAAAPPGIEIIEPQLPTTRNAGLPTVMARDGDSKVIIGRIKAAVGVMSLMINDQEQPVDEGGLFRINVPLTEAKTKISVVAVDAMGRRASMAFMIERQIAVRNLSGDAPQLTALKLDVEFGNYHALVIGNNDYKLLPKLETAVGDAEAVADLLKTRYGFKVTLLRNATRYAILSTFNKLREELSEDDNLLIYYAGHGELDRVNNRGHWLPVDAEPDSTANWISNIQVTDVLNAMSVKQLLVVADSCYSGTLTRAAVARLDSGMSQSTRANWIKLMVNKRARLVLSSGGVQPVLDSGGGEHSVFAAAFLNALGANTQILEGQRLFSQVSQSVTSVREAAEIDQVPQYAPIKYAGHEAGDFFFVPVIN